MVHIVGDLIPKPLVTELMKAAPFFRLAEEAKPSYLIDEMDVFIEQDSDLLAAVNNGWEPHGGVLRCIGDDNEVRKFSTHTPVAMAGIELHKKLPATTVSRSVVVHLERAADDELDEDDVYEARKHRVGIHETGRRLARWCADAKQEIAGRDPTLPPKVRNRLADKWRPLFAIAEVAGAYRVVDGAQGRALGQRQAFVCHGATEYCQQPFVHSAARGGFSRNPMV